MKFRTWLKEEKERKIQLTIEKRQYWESRIGSVVAEIEKFKLDEHILQQAEESLAGKSKTELILSYDEVEQLRKNHNTTNIVALNSKMYYCFDDDNKELDLTDKNNNLTAMFGARLHYTCIMHYDLCACMAKNLGLLWFQFYFVAGSGIQTHIILLTLTKIVD